MCALSMGIGNDGNGVGSDIGQAGLVGLRLCM